MSKLAIVDVLDTAHYKTAYTSKKNEDFQLRGFVFGGGDLYTIESGTDTSSNSTLYLCRYSMEDGRLKRNELKDIGDFTTGGSRIDLMYYDTFGDPFLVFIGIYDNLAGGTVDGSKQVINFIKPADLGYAYVETAKFARDYLVGDACGFNGYDFMWQESWTNGDVDYIKVTGFGQATITNLANQYSEFTGGVSSVKFNTASDEYIWMQCYKTAFQTEENWIDHPVIGCQFRRKSDMAGFGVDTVNGEEGNVTIQSEGLVQTDGDDYYRRGALQYGNFSVISMGGKGYIIFQKEENSKMNVYAAEITDITGGEPTADIVIGSKKLLYSVDNLKHNHTMAQSFELETGNTVILTCNKGILVDGSMNVIVVKDMENGVVVWSGVKGDYETMYPFKGSVSNIPGVGVLAHGTSSNILHRFYEKSGQLIYERYPVLHNGLFGMSGNNERVARSSFSGAGNVGDRLIFVSAPAKGSVSPAILEVVGSI